MITFTGYIILIAIDAQEHQALAYFGCFLYAVAHLLPPRSSTAGTQITYP